MYIYIYIYISGDRAGDDIANIEFSELSGPTVFCG